MKNSTTQDNKTFTFVPLVDIHESETSTTIFLEVPGAQENTIDISFEKDVLVIKGSTALNVPEGYKTLYTELKQGEFVRKFTVNRALDIEKAEAVLKNGKLVLTLPKLNAVATKIPVKVA